MELYAKDNLGNYVVVGNTTLVFVTEPEPEPEPTPDPTGPYDLVPVAIRCTPQAPKPGDDVVFEADIKNIGTGTMPAGTVADKAMLATSFKVNGEIVSWADRYEGALKPGEIVTLVANGGPGDTVAGVENSPNRFWQARAGEFTISTHVNEIVSRKPNESDLSNNSMSVQVTISQDPVPPGPQPPDGTPDEHNTGPRRAVTGSITTQQWLEAGHAEGVRIVDPPQVKRERKRVLEMMQAQRAGRRAVRGPDTLRDEQGGLLIGKRLTAVDCILEDLFYMEPYTNDDLPQITLDHCSGPGINLFGGVIFEADWCQFHGQSYSASGQAWLPGFEDHDPNQIPRLNPWLVTNSLLHSPLPVPRSQGGWAHMETLHMVGANVDQNFTNVVFIQDGDADVQDSNVTGIVKTTQVDSTYTDCIFKWNGAPASYFSLNMEGRNVKMIRCKAQPGTNAFFFNSGVQPEPGVFSPIGGGGNNQYTLPECIDCTNLDTGAPFQAGD